MRSTTKDLAKYLLTYCTTHSDMVDAEFAVETIKNQMSVIRLNDAQEKFEKAKDKLIRNIPEGLTIQQVVADFLIMVHEAADGTTDQSD